MKICSQCNIKKSLSEYHNKNKTGIKKSYCKACAAIYRRKYYAKTREHAIKYAMESNKKKKEKLTKYVYDYLKDKSCLDCGESDPIVLEFDHIDVSKKTAGISEMILQKSSLKKLQEEIAKCEIRCANCHRRKTAYQFNWWITKM